MAHFMLDNGFEYPKIGEIYVFGSNILGIHGAGSAHYAKIYKGAVTGCGAGFKGESYAIPTKLTPKSGGRALRHIYDEINIFKEFARTNPHKRFFVSPLGTGLAGYRVADIAPFFRSVPPNVRLCQAFDRWLAANPASESL